MINQIKKILGFRKCARCGNLNIKSYHGLFNPILIYCFDCKDSLYEYGIWKHQESSKEMTWKIINILNNHAVPLPEQEMEEIARNILNIFKYKI